jgi:hypothetical protein
VTGDKGFFVTPGGALAIPDLLSDAAVKWIFHRSARTLRRWEKAGHLTPVQAGRAEFCGAEDIRRLVSGRIEETALRDAERAERSRRCWASPPDGQSADPRGAEGRAANADCFGFLATRYGSSILDIATEGRPAVIVPVTTVVLRAAVNKEKSNE